MRLYHTDKHFAIDTQIDVIGNCMDSNDTEYYAHAVMAGSNEVFYMPPLRSATKENCLTSIESWAKDEGFVDARPLNFNKKKFLQRKAARTLVGMNNPSANL